MFPQTYTLLQNEAFLMQGCFKSSLSELRKAPNAQPSHFYAVFFNFSIGLERLLKILLLLDKWHLERKFLTDDELKAKAEASLASRRKKAKGHNVENLYNDACALFHKYVVEWNNVYDLDSINRDLLNFLASFANGSRYYNLNVLAGAAPQ